MGKKRCTKRPYATKFEAQTAIASMARRFGPIVFKKAYRCGQCKAWHISSTPWTGRRRKKW
jgi:hypothetical protein